MLFSPKRAGGTVLSREELSEDRRGMKKIGPVGIGEKAFYPNSFYLSRRYYAAWEDIRRVYKRISMSKGGFTGKGLFSTIPYLVVELRDGTELQCNFKVEDQVDAVLDMIQSTHPGIPIHSRESEKKLRKARREEEARYVKDLSPKAEGTLTNLRRAKKFLEEDDRFSRLLVYTAKEKRSVDGMKPSVKAIAIVLGIVSLGFIIAGLVIFLNGNHLGLYLDLIGAAFMMTVLASRALPTPNRNRKSVSRDWEEAIQTMERHLQDQSRFPVPPQYAHPIVLQRMIRVVKEGRAETAEEALAVVKEDLKALNSSVTVSQEEHDEVVTIKPLFLVSDYQ